jgi:hypothetical protein
MKTIHRLILPLSVLCLVMLWPAAIFAGDEWRPVTPEELAAKTPSVEKDADAEALFWEVKIDDSLAEELSLKNYIRVKIYTERGKESQSKIDIRYAGTRASKTWQPVSLSLTAASLSSRKKISLSAPSLRPTAESRKQNHSRFLALSPAR